MKLANPEPLGLHFRHPRYFDRADLDRELDRIFDICHGCRLCLHLCPSFPALFDAVDSHENEVAGLTAEEEQHVADLCYQCKLCYVKCPYTPPHEYNLDFPRVMLRARAVKGRERGIPMSDRVPAMTDLLGKLGGLFAPLSNAVLRTKAARVLMEKVTGIDRRRKLPEYHRQSFVAWWRTRKAPRPGGEAGKVVLFATCSVNYSGPEVGRAAAYVLEKNGVKVEVPTQECCGMPALDGGLVEQAAKEAARNVRTLMPYVREGYTVVTPGPTCSYMMKNEWPELLESEDARLVAKATMDLGEYLRALASAGKLSKEFVKPLGAVAYHVPCHLKAQSIGLASRDLLALVPGTTVEVIDRCSGVDGTWGLRHAYYDRSVKVADKLVAKVNDGDKRWDAVVSDCPLAGLPIAERTRYTPEHPVVALARAYGYDARATDR